MDRVECLKLADRFKKMAESGLVDVKFFLRNVDEAVSEKVCAEINHMYEALDKGEYVPLQFKDSYR